MHTKFAKHKYSNNFSNRLENIYPHSRPTFTGTPSPTQTPFCCPQESPIVSVTPTPNGRIADTRTIEKIRFATIHHSEDMGASNFCDLLEHARFYDEMHGYRDYDDDGLEDDARPTLGEFGYNWVSYHFLIGRDGTILQIQDVKYVRFHAFDSCLKDSSHNLHAIAICLDGNFNKEKPTQHQIQAAASIIHNWKTEYGTELEISAHKYQEKYCNETTLITTCPGKNMGEISDQNSAISRIIALAKTG